MGAQASRVGTACMNTRIRALALQRRGMRRAAVSSIPMPIPPPPPMPMTPHQGRACLCVFAARRTPATACRAVAATSRGGEPRGRLWLRVEQGNKQIAEPVHSVLRHVGVAQQPRSGTDSNYGVARRSRDLDSTGGEQEATRRSHEGASVPARRGAAIAQCDVPACHLPPPCAPF
eukprot:356701-Chlamydomonas_euryale.AAC.15